MKKMQIISPLVYDRVKHYSWKKVGLAAALIILAFQTFEVSGFKLRLELQKYITCMPFTWYLTQEKALQHDDITIGDMVYLSGDFSPEHFPQDLEILKIVAAKHGDVVSRVGEQYFINDRLAGSFLPTMTPFLFDGQTYELKTDDYWLLASSVTALDSRYFGPVSHMQFLGRGYGLY
jgi:type IV secretory pathway protease TraF